MNHISGYILERNCFQMIFVGKDLPMETGVKSISQCILRKTFVVYHIEERKTVTGSGALEPHR